MASNELVYAVVHNILSNFHSIDLRNFFSQFIETNSFKCFHFKRRPEFRDEHGDCKSNETNNVGCKSNETNNATEPLQPSKLKPKPTALCCIIALLNSKFNHLMKMYHKKHWLDRKGNMISERCFISRFKISEMPSVRQEKYIKLEEPYQSCENFSTQHLKSLPELHPPLIMPKGNVGTPTLFFLKLIQECRLPPRIISKLGLSFPMTRGKNKYSSVPHDYGRPIVKSSNRNKCVKTATGHKLSDVFIQTKLCKEECKQSKQQCLEDNLNEDDDDDGEEWERHEALHDDVTSQERNKERLFESELEVTWEKGGSGLVFHTDASYWHAEDGDFDAQTADDWDIDMSVYYDPDGGDKDAKDFVQMRKEKFLRNGQEDDIFNKSIGKFEMFTKGVGRKILEKQGWKDGQGLGKSFIGIADALEGEGQQPRCKRGFGYYGEKLNRKPKKLKTADRQVIISTIYDDPKETDPNESLLRSNPPYSLNYRDEVKFAKAANESTS